MNFTDQQRDDAYGASSEVQKSLYEGPASGQALYDIGKNHGLVEVEVRMSFLIAVGDVVIGLVPQAQLPQLMIERLGVSQATAMRITADVLDFLEPLDATKTAAPVATNIPIQTPTAVADPGPISLADELAAAEATFHQLQPIRTMAGDMQTLKHDVPIHQAASQETLLNGDGNGKKNPGAQWGEQ
jgi:hypothetical protein